MVPTCPEPWSVGMVPTSPEPWSVGMMPLVAWRACLSGAIRALPVAWSALSVDASALAASGGVRWSSGLLVRAAGAAALALAGPYDGSRDPGWECGGASGPMGPIEEARCRLITCVWGSLTR